MDKGFTAQGLPGDAWKEWGWRAGQQGRSPARGPPQLIHSLGLLPRGAESVSRPEFASPQDKGASPHTPTPVSFWGQATQGT